MPAKPPPGRSCDKYEVRVEKVVYPLGTWYYVQYRRLGAFAIFWEYYYGNGCGGEYRSDCIAPAIEEAKRLKEKLNRPDPHPRYVYV
jgi:hypothetical protein